MKTVLCYGDSNTWGAVPMANWIDRQRFGAEERWTGVVQAQLGADWQVIAEGLPGRTTIFDDPVEGPYLSGINQFRGCLESHRPIDIVVLALGTNDFKRRLNIEAEDVAVGIGKLLEEIRRFAERFRCPAPQVLLVCPPLIKVTGIFTTMYRDAERKSKELAPMLRQLAADNRIAFLDAAGIVETSPIDGIHLDRDGHDKLGRAVAASTRNFAAIAFA